MANPQKENGYTAIANEILEHLALIRISGEARQVLDVIIRQTYGFQKKEDKISLSQFQEKTNLPRSNVCRAVSKLRLLNIIIIKKETTRNSITKYSLNKNYDSWVVVSKLIRGSLKLDNKVVSNLIIKQSLIRDIQKKERKKETITKEIAEHSSADTRIPELIKEFEKVNPTCKRFYGNTTQRSACQFLIDTYGFEKVLMVISRTLPKSNTLDFFPTITTPCHLRDKWATLESAIRKHQSKIKKNTMASIKQ